MKSLAGVYIQIEDGYGLCHILDFSDELKQVLRKHLVRICHGENKSSTSYAMYRYAPTLQAFLERYENKSENTKKGMIGELLSHIIINEFFDNFEIASPFFNLEEKSIKKGFDILLYSKLNKNLWITEVKSGEIHKGKDVNETAKYLLNTAYNDLKERLNENETNHWNNAVNAATIAVSDNKDYKKLVMSILDDEYEKTYKKSPTSKDNNVFLISNLFYNINSKIDGCTVSIFQEKILKKSEFSDVFCLSIQKGTLNKIVDFIFEESKRV